MPLKKACELLKTADAKGRAVIGFDAFNLESVSWIIEVAEEEQIPVILMIYPTMASIMPFSTFAAVTKDLASKAKVPVALMLDHGADFDMAMEAIKAGFTSIMIDCSHFDYEENVLKTREVVKVCHGLGIDVEGELGRVGIASNEDDYTNIDNFTTVENAVDFIEKTGVDILAISIGTAHGNYVSAPNLDLERLSAINKATDVPLVLHGGTGVPEDQIKEAIKMGINKLNMATGYNMKMYESMADVIIGKSSRPRMTDLIHASKGPVKDYLRAAMRMAWPEEK